MIRCICKNIFKTILSAHLRVCSWVGTSLRKVASTSRFQGNVLMILELRIVEGVKVEMTLQRPQIGISCVPLDFVCVCVCEWEGGGGNDTLPGTERFESWRRRLTTYECPSLQKKCPPISWRWALWKQMWTHCMSAERSRAFRSLMEKYPNFEPCLVACGAAQQGHPIPNSDNTQTGSSFFQLF